LEGGIKQNYVPLMLAFAVVTTEFDCGPFVRCYILYSL